MDLLRTGAYIITTLILLLLVAGIIFLSYWIPKKMGYRKIGLVISGLLTVPTVLFILLIVFKDRLFFNTTVNEYLRLTDIRLNDDFTIISNSNSWSTGYHKFELSISQADKERIIEQIKSSNEFFVDSKNDFFLPDKAETLSDTTMSANYEDSLYFRQETYSLSDGYAPSLISVSIDKKRNTLIFEQSDR